MIRFIIIFALLIFPAYAQQGTVVGPNPTATGQAATGQIPGTATNDNANSGNDGEYRYASNADTGTAQGGATVTITIASPAVVTWGTTTPFVFNGSATAVVNFTTTGALPTGIVAGTNYYAFNLVGNTFNIATTADNAIAGTAINTSGSQSGVQTGVPTAILADNVTSTVAALALSAGDWDIQSDLVFFAATTTAVTVLSASNSNTATIATIPGQFTQFSYPSGNVFGVSNTSLHVGPLRVSLSAPATLYATTRARFTVSTLATWGSIRARRVR